MKTKEQIIELAPVYLHDWESSKLEGVLADFAINDRFDLFDEGVKVLFATYSEANYSGDAFVLYEKGGKLYEVNASHCSCYGLEGQWLPEIVSLKELEHRIVEGEFGSASDWGSGNEFKRELADFLGIKLELKSACKRE